MSQTYWLETPITTGSKTTIKEGGILVVGSGITGVSVAYWLQKLGCDKITIVDNNPERSATYRNCGHILNGTVESMQALSALHGEKVAKDIWSFSVECCELMKNSIQRLNLNCEYNPSGYLVIALDDSEMLENEKSVALLNKMGFDNSIIKEHELKSYGFKDVKGARFEKNSSSAHPVKFRNQLLKKVTNKGCHYHSNQMVEEVSEDDHRAIAKISGKEYSFDAIVLATNAYSPLLSSHIKNNQLIEPFKGQILTSEPLKEPIKFLGPHSFDHGYIYALLTIDNRLMIGGWRNHVKNDGSGPYDLNVNDSISCGLKDFVKNHYNINEKITWRYAWTGVMAASKTGFPFIGPIGYRLFTCSGFTGHGFSWAHGSARLLAQIMNGKDYDKNLAPHFNPMTFI